VLTDESEGQNEKGEFIGFVATVQSIFEFCLCPQIKTDATSDFQPSSVRPESQSHKAEL
jgi:hypothetical protein